MKKIIVFMLLMIFAVSMQPVYADETVSEIESLDDGCYYETVSATLKCSPSGNFS